MFARKRSVYPSTWGLLLLIVILSAACSEPAPPATPQVIVVTATSDSAVAQVEPTPVVVTVVVTPTEDAAAPEPTATATSPAPTEEPTPIPPTETPLPEPTATPIPEPTATPAPPQPDWLAYLNRFRAMAGLSDLVENVELSYGDLQHSRYMVNTDRLHHYEVNDVEWYSEEGNVAAKNGNIAASQVASAPDEWPIEYWISAPFHLVPIIDPQLREVGFAVQRNSVGEFHMAAAMDVLQGFSTEAVSLTNPILFPGDGAETWVIRHSLYEWPNPKTSCPGYPGYPEPVGPPIVVQVGLGSRTPRVSQHSFSVEGFELPHCVFDETNFTNPDAYQQEIGRIILDERDAIVLMPRHPLEIGKTYTVRLVVDGEEIEWSFTAINKPG